MPIDRFVLIVVIVLAAAGVTVAVAAWVQAAFTLPGIALAVAAPALLVAYVVVRIIAERLKNRDDDHYDRIDR